MSHCLRPWEFSVSSHWMVYPKLDFEISWQSFCLKNGPKLNHLISTRTYLFYSLWCWQTHLLGTSSGTTVVYICWCNGMVACSSFQGPESFSCSDFLLLLCTSCCYWVKQTLVKVWQNSKKLWKHSPMDCVPTAFLVLANFHSCFYNSTETQYMFPIS